MIDIINTWEKKGFRFCIIPQLDKGKWVWTAGVYIGMEKKADWINNFQGYESYQEAFDDLVKYCENYKPKKIRTK